VSAIAETFGSQCVVVSIDVGHDEVVVESGARRMRLDPVDHARRVEDLGAGELLLTSIERDGTMTGYDLELISRITGAVTIPVIASGGAGTYEDMAAAIGAGASAVAAASLFHFTEQTPLEAKRFLHEQGIPVRL
jgi:cyclase